MIENLGSEVRHTDKMPKTPYSTQETTETDEDGEELTRNHSGELDAPILCQSTHVTPVSS